MKTQRNYLQISGNVNNEAQFQDIINTDDNTAVSDFPDDDDTLQSVCKLTVELEEGEEEEDDEDEDWDQTWQDKKATNNKILQ